MAASTDERSALCRGPVVAARRVEVRDDGRLREHPQRVVRGRWRVQYRGACDARAVQHRGQLATVPTRRPCLIMTFLTSPFLRPFPAPTTPPLPFFLHLYYHSLYILITLPMPRSRYWIRPQARTSQALPKADQDQQLVGGGSHASTNMCVISPNEPGRDALTLTRGGRRGHAHTRN